MLISSDVRLLQFLHDVDGDLHIAQMEEESLRRQLNCVHVNSSSYLPASTEHSNGHVSTTELRLRLTDVTKSRQELGIYTDICSFWRDRFFDFV